MTSVIALIISLCSLLISFDVWRRSWRPVVTVMVKTHAEGNVAILYDLVIKNSGSLPALNIRITPVPSSLEAALGKDASEDNRKRWLACFDQTIAVLQNDAETSCSFGTTQANDTGFWKYKALIRVTITYQLSFGWFIFNYRDEQDIQIASSESFTGYSWE